MAGRSPGAAYKQYVEPLQDALRCLTEARLTFNDIHRSHPIRERELRSIALNDLSPLPLKGPLPIMLSVGQQFMVVRAEDGLGPFSVQVVAYFYSLAMATPASVLDNRTAEIINFQWNPSGLGRRYPHLHIGPAATGTDALFPANVLQRTHVPTASVSIEAVIRMVIEEFSVQPIKDDWESTLARADSALRRHSIAHVGDVGE